MTEKRRVNFPPRRLGDERDAEKGVCAQVAPLQSVGLSSLKDWTMVQIRVPSMPEEVSMMLFRGH